MTILEKIYNGDYDPDKASKKMPFSLRLRTGRFGTPLKREWARRLSSVTGRGSVKWSISETTLTSEKASV